MNENAQNEEIKEFDNQIEQVYEISSRYQLFVVEDIENLISQEIFKDVNIYVLVKDFTKNTLLSSLSIVKYNNKIEHFDSIEKLEVYLKEKNIPYQANNQKRRDLKIYDEKYPIYLVIEGKYIFNIMLDPLLNFDRVFDKLLESLREIVIGTTNYDNLSMEHNQRKIRKLEKKINDLPDFNWKNLCQFINEEEKTKVGYFIVSPRKEIKNKEETNADYFVISTQKEININGFISDFELPFLKEFQTKDGFKMYKPFLKESILSGKSIVFFDNKTKNYIAIIPVIERYQAPKFIKEIFIIWSEQRIKNYNISNIKDYIGYLKKQERLQQASFLSEIQAEVIEKFKGNGYNNKDELLYDFKAFSEKCLKQIIKTTYAHSAVVRLYNASKNALTKFIVECTDWGKWNGCEIGKANDIKLKLQHCSVNAFVFTKASNLEEPYVYINHFKKTIPEKYKKNGLNHILLFRKNSMSEICFPLFVGKIPFGVLNVESPIIDAFDDDIHYLLSIKQAMESFYDISIKTTDSRWLAERSLVYKNVHEIERLFEKKDFLNEYQLSFLRPLILFETNIHNSKPIKLNVLEKRIDDFLKEEVDKSSRNDLKLFYWHIDKNNEIFVDNNTLNKIELIVFNLIENIISHSNIHKDMINCYINNNNELSIKVETYGIFDDYVFNSLTYSPILKETRYHYGMFLVGMLSRNLGGVSYVENSEDKKGTKFTIIKIVIPLNGDKT